MLAPFLVEPAIFLNPQPYWGSPTGLDTYAWSCFRVFEGAAIRQGEIPFWNPYVLNGVPWQGWITNVIHPGSLLHWLNLSPSLFSKVSLYFALVWGFLGGSLWCKSLGRSEVASLCGGLLFAHGGLFMGQLYAGHLEIVVAMSWSPWLAWAGERYWRSPSLKGALGASLAGALLMLSGSMQVFYLTYLAVSLHGCLTRAQLVSWRLRTFGSALAGWVFSCAVMMLLTVFQWWPLLQSRAYCNRPINDPDYFCSFAGQPENLLSWILPHFFDSSNYDRFWTNPAYWEGCEYLGLLGLTFLVAGLVRSGQQRGPTVIVMVLSCLIAYDSSCTLLKGYANLGIDPAVTQFRCPSRFLLWLHLYAGPLLASGMDGWLSREDVVRRWVQRWLVGLFSAYFVGLCALQLLDPNNLGWLSFCRALCSSEAVLPTTAATLYVSQYSRALWMFFLCFAMLVGWRHLDRTPDLSSSKQSRWLFVLLALDLASVVKPWLTTGSEINFLTAPPDQKLLSQCCPVGQRFEMALPNVLQGMTLSKEELSGFLPISSLAYQEYWRTAMRRWRPNLSYQSFIVVFASPTPPPLASFFGCDQAFATKNRLEPWKAQFPPPAADETNPGGWQIDQSSSTDSDVSLLHFERSKESKNSRFAFHQAAAFLPAELVYARLSKPSLEPYPLWLSERQSEVPPEKTESEWSVKDLKLGVNGIELSVSSTQGGYFTTKDAFWPGWKAWVDEVPTEVVSSYAGLCRTIKVPPGTHRVKFHFSPPGWSQLIRISGLGWLIAVAVVFWLEFGALIFQRWRPSLVDPEGTTG